MRRTVRREVQRHGIPFMDNVYYVVRKTNRNFALEIVRLLVEHLVSCQIVCDREGVTVVVPREHQDNARALFLSNWSTGDLERRLGEPYVQ